MVWPWGPGQEPGDPSAASRLLSSQTLPALGSPPVRAQQGGVTWLGSNWRRLASSEGSGAEPGGLQGKGEGGHTGVGLSSPSVRRGKMSLATTHAALLVIACDLTGSKVTHSPLWPLPGLGSKRTHSPSSEPQFPQLSAHLALTFRSLHPGPRGGPQSQSRNRPGISLCDHSCVTTASPPLWAPGSRKRTES